MEGLGANFAQSKWTMRRHYEKQPIVCECGFMDWLRLIASTRIDAL